MRFTPRPDDIVAISAVRTPIGRFGGTLRSVRAYELGAVVIAAAVERAGIPADRVDEVVLGHCRQAGNGPNPVRSAALLAGVPETVPSTTVNMACPSGMKAIGLAAAALRTDAAQVVVAGGMDSMSTIPHMIRNLRFSPVKMGNLIIEDGWVDATDPIAAMSMGQTAVHLARATGITREEQDAYALRSHQRAVEAARSGAFSDELVPVDIPPRFDHGPVHLTQDETPRPDTSLEKLASLPPVFDPDGTVTAGNASSMSDGACALVLTTRAQAQSAGRLPLFSLRGFAQTAVSGAVMGTGPQYSIPLVLRRAGLSLDDMDLVEINEAFAVQVLANQRALHIDDAKLNPHGGAIALGHPTGISGARIAVTLAHALRRHDKQLGLAAICGAGGVTTAMIIERES